MSKRVSTRAGDFDLTAYTQLKRLYKQALKTKADTFLWNKEPMAVDFAKYLIEFLDPHFKHIK